MSNFVGRQLGNYRLKRLLGRSGFAEVYLGEHVHLQSQAAIKVLRAVVSEEQQTAFLQEARSLVRLRHPHIVRLLDFTVQDDLPFLVMEYAPHGSLLDRHSRGTRLPVESVIAYVRQVASALQYAHEQRLVHRDVKPANLLLGTREEVLLSDFGLATLLSSTSADQVGEVLALQGTTPYLAPEQLHGKPGAASDQYALGVVAYEWLCGRLPFSGTVTEVALQHLTAAPRPLRELVPELSPALEAVVLRTLSKEPRERFASIQDFASALEQAAAQVMSVTHFMPFSPVEQPGQSTPPPAARALPAIWNIPYRRSPFFTGRESLLKHMRAYFASERPGALPLALCGLGGIGKTQLAVEYAYRYQQQYQAVLWARAASRDTLIADFVGVATHLQLSIEAEQDELQAVEALKHWLTEHTGWLLILDNADDLALAAEFLPTTGKGHMLLTSRVQATGRFASSLPVERLDEQEAMTLLLRRAGLLAMGASLESLALPTRTQALAIVHVMDSLPLALDQAGAYIEETASSLSEYLHLYQQRRSRLLARQSSLSSDYPYTVASAWALSFQRAEQANSAAADLLRLGAFLNPDAIPEVILTAGASFLGPVLGPVAADLLSLHEAIQVLRRYSLLKRDPEAKLLYIHRLVQAVLKDAMDPQMQRIWAERTIQAVNAAFPEASHGTWSLCRQLVPHALACAELINEYDLAFPEAARLLLQTGVYLEETGQLVQAQPLLQAALTMREQVLGPTHPDIAIILDHLAWIYCRQGKYEQSEALYQRALMITEHASGHMHPDLIFTLNHLAWLYMDQGRYAQAEALLQRSLAIKEYTSDAEDFKLADTLNDLARLHFLQGNYATSEALLQRVLSISERVQGPEHPDTAFIIASLAYFLRFQGKYEQSEVLHLRGLRILEQVLDPEHLEIAFSLDSLGSLYHLQGKYEQAIPLYERALAIREHVQGPEHPDTAGTLDNLALSFRVQGNYTQAEELHQRALAIRTQKLGPESLATVFSLVHLADLFLARQHYTQAEPLYQQALAIREQKLGPNHPDTATSLDRLAYLYYLQKQYTQAEPLYQRALEIRERMLGPEHPDTATTLDHLANLYQDQGQHRLAEPLYQRALAILEHVLGPEHPDTVSVHIRFTSLQEHLSSGAALQEPRSDAAKVLDTPPAKYPVRLTRREVEVLRMVAQGLTNAQIAAQLVLSEKTVINHLTHIFNKIGCDNRTAATAFAIRHHLA